MAGRTAPSEQAKKEREGNILKYDHMLLLLVLLLLGQKRWAYKNGSKMVIAFYSYLFMPTVFAPITIVIMMMMIPILALTLALTEIMTSHVWLVGKGLDSAVP